MQPARLRSTVRRAYAVNIIRGDRRNGVAQPITNAADGSASFRKPVDNIGTKSIPQYADLREQPHLRHRDPWLRQRPHVRRSAEGLLRRQSRRDVRPRERLQPARRRERGSRRPRGQERDVVRLEVPIACLVRSASEPIIGGWTTASLGVGMPNGPGPDPVLPPRAAGAAPPDRRTRPDVGARPELRRAGSRAPPGRAWRPRRTAAAPAAGTQVSRLGAPLVNEVVIGLRDKDLFNSASADAGLCARELCHEPDAARVAGDPLRRAPASRRRTISRAAISSPRSSRHRGPQPAGRASSRRRCSG